MNVSIGIIPYRKLLSTFDVCGEMSSDSHNDSQIPPFLFLMVNNGYCVSIVFRHFLS